MNPIAGIDAPTYGMSTRSDFNMLRCRDAESDSCDILRAGKMLGWRHATAGPQTCPCDLRLLIRFSPSGTSPTTTLFTARGMSRAPSRATPLPVWLDMYSVPPPPLSGTSTPNRGAVPRS